MVRLSHRSLFFLVNDKNIHIHNDVSGKRRSLVFFTKNLKAKTYAIQEKRKTGVDLKIMQVKDLKTLCTRLVQNLPAFKAGGVMWASIDHTNRDGGNVLHIDLEAFLKEGRSGVKTITVEVST